MRNLPHEIQALKDALNGLLANLDTAQNHLNQGKQQWAEDELENVYWQLFKLAEQSDSLRQLIAEGERKARTQTTQETRASLAPQGETMAHFEFDETQLSQDEKQQLEQMARFYAISKQDAVLLIMNQHLGGYIAQHFNYLLEHNAYFSDYIERQGGKDE